MQLANFLGAHPRALSLHNTVYAPKTGLGPFSYLCSRLQASVRVNEAGEGIVSGQLLVPDSQRVFLTVPAGKEMALLPAAESTFTAKFSCPDKAGHNVQVTFVNKGGRAPSFLRLDGQNQKVDVFGSCVSRDAFEYSGALSLGNYYARSSVASAFDLEPSGLAGTDLAANPSQFQRRVAHDDLARSAAGVLANSHAACLLVDFVDERFPLLKGEGGYFTYSNELQRAGLDAAKYDRVNWDSKRYWAAFEPAWKRLVAAAPGSKVIVNRAYWATTDSAGKNLANGKTIRWANSVLRRTYARVRRLTPSVQFIDYDASMLVADPEHKWGRGPYHYVPEFYRQLNRSLRRLLALPPTL